MPPLRHSRQLFPELPHHRGDINPYLAKIQRDHHLHGTFLRWGAELQHQAGSWHSWFKSHRKSASCHHLVVEIGCHFGHTLAEMAADHQNCAFVGIDITLKRVYKSAWRLYQQGAYHGCVIYFNAKHLEAVFAPGEIDTVIIFFPDPWNSKARQLKHRLLSTEFINTLYKLLSPGGYVWFKTDCTAYFEATLAPFEVSGFQPLTTPHPVLISTHPSQTYRSLFEQRFLAQNQPIHEQLYQKPNPSTHPTTNP